MVVPVAVALVLLMLGVTVCACRAQVPVTGDQAAARYRTVKRSRVLGAELENYRVISYDSLACPGPGVRDKICPAHGRAPGQWCLRTRER